MKKFLPLVSCCVLVFVSCRRDNDKPAASSGVLLTLIVDSNFTSGTLASIDSIKFSYDGAGRLSGWGYRTGLGSMKSGQENSLTRDNLDRVLQETQQNLIVNSGVAQPDGPKIITDFHYNPGAEDPDYYYQYSEGQLETGRDSVALEYSGSNITAMRVFDLSGASPEGSFTENIWTYDAAGHMTSRIVGAQDSTHPAYYTYTFDGKVNPLKMGIEVLSSNGNLSRLSAGNIVSSHYNWPSGGLVGYETSAYTYRSDDRPIRAISTGANQPYTNNENYFYSDN